MKVRWTTEALQHLHEAYDYIQLDKPSAAARMAVLIETATQHLGLFPAMGRPSKRPATRELAIAGTPFILVYRVKNDVLEILALYHSAQNWQERL
jgi:addiction module RelE/StbE family toxin